MDGEDDAQGCYLKNGGPESEITKPVTAAGDLYISLESCCKSDASNQYLRLRVSFHTIVMRAHDSYQFSKVVPVLFRRLFGLLIE